MDLLNNFIEAQTFKEIGEGRDTVVYHKKGTHSVIKMTKNPKSYDTGGTGSIAPITYWKWCMRNRGKFLHVPKVSGVKHRAELYYAEMEKLYHADTRIADALDNIVCEWIADKNSRFVSYLIVDAKRRFKGVTDQFMEEFRKIYNLADERGYYFDGMTGGNLMKRKDGTLVISDPWC